MAYKHPYDHFKPSDDLKKGLHTVRSTNTATFNILYLFSGLSIIILFGVATYLHEPKILIGDNKNIYYGHYVYCNGILNESSYTGCVLAGLGLEVTPASPLFSSQFNSTIYGFTNNTKVIALQKIPVDYYAGNLSGNLSTVCSKGVVEVDYGLSGYPNGYCWYNRTKMDAYHNQLSIEGCYQDFPKGWYYSSINEGQPVVKSCGVLNTTNQTLLQEVN